MDLKCPICGGFDEQDHFACPKCNRENICGSHYNFDFLVCEDCAKEMAPPVKKDAAKKKGVGIEEIAIVEEEPEKSPFYIRQLKCPVCGTSGEQRWFQAKIYSEQNIDVDKQVQNFVWTEKVFEKYHPPLYYMWHCYNCHYTDSYIDFENPSKDSFSNFRFLKDTFIDQYQDDPRVEKIIDKLGENVDYDKMNYYLAIKTHLLAIFIQELLEDEEERDSLKIGRYYLRLGWLYRELNQKVEISDKIKSTLVKLIKFLKKGWPEVAGDEQSALKKAIEMLNQAFKTSHAIKSVVVEVDLLMLIAGIHIKLEENEEGLKVLNSLLGRAQKTKLKLTRRIKESEKTKEPLPAEELKRFDIQLKRLDGLISKARDIISDLKAERMKEERKKAKAIIKTLGELPPQEIREILLKKGIDKRIALELAPEPKKKFLGLF